MGRDHDHRRGIVCCTNCNRPFPARLIESGNDAYWQPLGLANRDCPECGHDEYEELDV